MTKGRLEAFSDGVLAIVITIMVLELRPPSGTALEDLFPLWPKFLSYGLSFTFIAIYWVNHHHLFQAVKVVTGRVLWANMLLLFALSLVPFATAWMGENAFGGNSMTLYGVILILPAMSYYLLVQALVSAPGQPTTLADALGSDFKGKASIAIYLVTLPLSLIVPLVALAIYIGVAIMWIAPDPRIERALSGQR